MIDKFSWATILLYGIFIFLILIFIKRLNNLLPKAKKYFIFLLDKNKIGLAIILSINLIFIPFFYVFYKLFKAIPTWQVLLGELIFLVLFMTIINTHLIILFFEGWYSVDKQTKNIKTTPYKSGDLLGGVIISILFIYLTTGYLFRPEILPHWLYNFLLNMSHYNY